MFKFLVAIGKKLTKYAAIAFTGYEVGNQVSPKDTVQLVKETTIVTKENANSNFENVAVIASVMFFIAIVFFSIQQTIKCIKNRNNNSNVTSTSITLESQPSIERLRS